MAAPDVVAAALAKTIDDYLEDEMYVYDHVPDSGHLPAVLVEEGDGEFTAFNRGSDEWTYRVFVLVSRVDPEEAQRRLRGYIAASGPNSIRQILFDHPDIGLTDGTDVTVTGVGGVGGSFNWGGDPHIGAILQVRVITDGRT